MPTFTTPDPITATVQVAGARVRITASDRPDTVVRVEPIDEASRSDIKVAEKTKIDLTDGRLSVKMTKTGDKDGSVAITIDLPTGSNLVAYLAQSTVQAEGSLGDCELHQGSGRVMLDRIDALRANMSAGEVAIGHIAGRAAIDAREVSMQIGEVEGALGFSSSGGKMWIGHASADLELRSGSGSFDVDRADGTVTAETGAGPIRIGRLTNGRARLQNGRGDIEVGIGDGAAVSLDLDSERGAVHDLVSPQAAVDPSAPEVMVHARTRHGDIIVRRAN